MLLTPNLNKNLTALEKGNLCEAYGSSKSTQFCWAVTKPISKKVTRFGPWMHCKEYVNDVMITYDNPSDNYSVYGFNLRSETAKLIKNNPNHIWLGFATLEHDVKDEMIKNFDSLYYSLEPQLGNNWVRNLVHNKNPITIYGEKKQSGKGYEGFAINLNKKLADNAFIQSFLIFYLRHFLDAQYVGTFPKLEDYQPLEQAYHADSEAIKLVQKAWQNNILAKWLEENPTPDGHDDGWVNQTYSLATTEEDDEAEWY